MSAHRVIPDSDDEEGHFSDVATSVDPLSETPQKGLRDMAAAHAPLDGLQMPWHSSVSDSGLPQVDFDQFLRSEPSFTSSPQQRRWIPGEDGNGSVVVPFHNNEREQRQDGGFIYSVNAPYACADGLSDTELPPTCNGEDDDLSHHTGLDTAREDVGTRHEHPQKRRRISLSADFLQGSTNKTGGSQDVGASDTYSKSFRPTEISQTTTMPFTSSDFNQPEPENYGAVGSGRSKSLQPQYESPPPTEPFSSMLSPKQKRSKTDLADVQSTLPPASELQIEPIGQVDADLSTSKKKRGRPKKQAVHEDVEDDAQDEVDVVPEPTVQTTKRRRGRPKKQVAEDLHDEISNGTDVLESELEPPTEPEQASRKKKMKRSKTTSAVPRKPTELDVERDVIWIDDDSVHGGLEPDTAQEPRTESATKEEHDTAGRPAGDGPWTENTAPEPKKRDRKRKQTNTEPPTEPPAILQDISNLSHPPPSTNEVNSDRIEVVIDKQQRDTSDRNFPSRNDPSTPKKQTHASAPAEGTPKNNDKEDDTAAATSKRGPDQHSPIAKTSKVPYRVGLSRRARIAPLLKVVRK